MNDNLCLKRERKIQEENLMFTYCTIINQEIFFVETQNGLPAKINPDNGDVFYYSVMENFIAKAEKTKYDVRTFEDKIYALETSGENIAIFDLNKLQCQYIPLQCSYHKWGNFVAFEQYGIYFYIFPRYENSIFVMNTIIAKSQK